MQELNGTTPVATLLTGLGIDEILVRTESIGAMTFLTDILGSTIALTDSTGTIQTQYSYEPFGRTLRTGASSSNGFKFTGREDDATKMYYFRARYYHPELQRFISQDPIGLGGGVNEYAYAGNDPINSRDPLGLKVRINGSPAQQSFILSQIGKFAGGSFTIGAGGFLGRTPYCMDGSNIEGWMNDLINSDTIFDIFAKPGDFRPADTNWNPMTGAWDMKFDPNIQHNYQTGGLGLASSTPASALAHELLGRGIRILRGEHLSLPSGQFNANAVNRANEAYNRMGMPPRVGY